VLNYPDFDRVFRVIQKHALLKLDILHREETEVRVEALMA